jgi:hypothetical protein
MAQFASDTDLLEYEPQIHDFGIQDFGNNPNLHEKTYDDIIRLLNIKWYPTAEYGRYNASVLNNLTGQKLDENKIVEAQFTRAAVYHVLAYYIYPKLSTFDPDGDSFQNKLNYYKNKFEEEFDLILQEGVKYDLDSDGTIDNSEQQTFYYNRLQR